MRKLYLLLCTGCILWSGNAYSQSKEYVYEDSVITAPGEEELITVDEEDEDEDYLITKKVKADTVLFYTNLPISVDTVNYWKNMPAFGYSRYLDSLLKIKKNAANKNSKAEKDKQKPLKDESDSKTTIGQEERNSPVYSGSAFFNSGFAKGLFWLLAVCFIAVVVYLLFFKDGFFKGNTRSIPAAAENKEDADLAPGADMDTLIANALRNGNYRLAVRYQYLKCLHRLCDRNILQFAADKTNYQYVQEIGNAALRNDFAGLTLHYEYVWYGEFAIDEIIYKKLETGFTAFLQKT